MSEEFSTSKNYKYEYLLDEFHDEIDSEFILEHVLHVDDEGVFNAEEDVFLEFDVLVLLVVDDDVLPDALHGVDLLVLHVLNEEHLPEGPLTDHISNYEICQLGLVLLSSEN